ncbi:unnamed protein product [Brachionus calyciflorus]|uniref:CNH domain-containing protein n=1 Tax=Brachionus calyciflorus TaxID=104777 RepID=A0A813MEP7_9BILA|nr:unnamed protein product [Brachionus calyciflorus]
MSSLMKVFDQVPVVKRLDGSLKNSQITCFTYSNTILYIGTNDGYILRYSINKSNYLGENVGFKSELIDFNQVNQRKTISMLSIVSRIQKILCLSDSILYPLNFEDLQPSSLFSILKNKNVTSYCFNERYIENKSELSILCVCIRGKTLQFYFIREGDVTFNKEISLPGVCTQMSMNQNYVCAACDNNYMIINLLNSNIQILFPYDPEQITPYIEPYLQDEFLLNCQGDLGMFATSDGQTTRPPVAWSSNTVKFQISPPYVLCLRNDSSIKVYNITDSKLRQEINNLGNVKFIKYVNEEKCLFWSTNNEIFALTPLSIISQVEQLLAKKMIDEAINLYEISSPNISKDDFEQQLRKIKIKAGFIEFFENDSISKSETLFLEANVDFKLLACMIPGLLPNFQPTDDLSQKYVSFLKDDSKIKSLKKLLIELMTKLKTVNKNEEFVNVLFRLCSELRDDLFNKLEFFSNLPIKSCLQNIDILKQANKYHAIGLIRKLANQNEEAFEIWKDLVELKKVDPNFPGFNFLIDQISSCNDHQLVWKYVDWAMGIDQTKGVEIFTKRSSDELNSERMRVDFILENLQKYKTAYLIYLDFLVNTKNLKNEKYVTQLLGIYLEKIIDLLKIKEESRSPDWSKELEKERLSFQNILETTANFKAQSILVQIKEFENVLQAECAILYGKIEEHEKALKILVYNLGDYKAATNYCLKNSNDSLKTRKNLFNILFSIYLNPTYSERERFLKPTLDLMNSKLIIYFDIPKLLDMIPNNWSLKLTGDFLQNVLSHNLFRKRTKLVEKNLATNYKFYLQTVLFSLKKEQLYVDDDTKCQKCHRPFDSTVLVRQPSGKLSHKSCKVDSKSPKV